MGGAPSLDESGESHLLARARVIAPLIAAAADEIEARCRLPAYVLDALHEAALFRMLLPRTVGGAEIEPATFVRVMEVIAEADASTAWCIGQASGCSMAAAYVSREVAQEIWGPDKVAVLTWGAGPQGLARVVPGGYCIAGTWPFASCSRHATWLGGHCRMAEQDGTLHRETDGKPVERTMLFPKHLARVTENWDVMGLRGTGSDTYAVEELFVPQNFTFSRDSCDERREGGTLYRFSTTNLYAVGFAAVAVGIARGTLDNFKKLAAEKTPMATRRLLRDTSSVQSMVGLAEAKLRAARSFLIATLEEIWIAAQRSGFVTLDQRMSMRMASSFAIREAREVVDMAFQGAGATAIFQSSAFERRFRDLHTLTQQVQAHSTHFETIGAHLLGLQPSLRFI
jgi:alkylation response protein AidB-like acyl-CoA dehydrogenase